MIEDPVWWFRFAWLDRLAQDDGVISLEDAIDALPIDGVGPARSRRLAAAFADWNDFVSTIRRASDELAAFSAKVGLPRFIDHLDFLRTGGADLLSDGVLGEEWPLPGDVGHLWRLMTIDGMGHQDSGRRGCRGQERRLSTGDR